MSWTKRRSRTGSARSRRWAVRRTRAEMPARVMASGRGRRSTAPVVAAIRSIRVPSIRSHSKERPDQPAEQTMRLEMRRGRDQADADGAGLGRRPVIQPAVGFAEIARLIAAEAVIESPLQHDRALEAVMAMIEQSDARRHPDQIEAGIGGVARHEWHHRDAGAGPA